MILLLTENRQDGHLKSFSLFSIIAFSFFTLICIFPLDFFYRFARWEVLKVLLNILISPFGVVRFKHFFLADILTSFTVPLKDLGFIFCFYTKGLWLDSSYPFNDDQTCPGLDNYCHIIVFIPFWFRFAQCLRRYYDNPDLKPQLVNAGKYLASISSLALNFARAKHHSNDSILYSYLAVSIFSTMYSYGWDLYMDWGLLRSAQKGKVLLRPKILYPPCLYYFAMLINLALRLLWILPLMPFSQFDNIKNIQVVVLIQALGEAFRRTMWALIRIENEKVNNFEKYRNILTIPSFKDEELQQTKKSV